MRVTINNKEVIIPSSLSEFTLGQRIDFHNQHGRLLDEMLDSILQMEDEYFREIDLVEWRTQKMYRTFSFFAGMTIEDLIESAFVDEVAKIYHASLAVMLAEEENMELQQEFIWKGEQWQLAPPEFTRKTNIKYGELIDAKQIIKDMVEMGRGKWEYMVKLCAIFFRKKGEAYDESFVEEDSDRLKLMHELPMNIALQVGFFLSGLINISMTLLKFSANQEQSQAASM